MTPQYRECFANDYHEPSPIFPVKKGEGRTQWPAHNDEVHHFCRYCRALISFSVEEMLSAGAIRLEGNWEGYEKGSGPLSQPIEKEQEKEK